MLGALAQRDLIRQGVSRTKRGMSSAKLSFPIQFSSASILDLLVLVHHIQILSYDVRLRVCTDGY
jgi:hypothetical protein